MKEFFLAKRFQDKSKVLINHANDIIEEYEGYGLRLTLRQLYYQFVARDLLPNTQKSYKNLGGIINDARLAGLIDWSAIEDRTRNLMGVNHVATPTESLERAAVRHRLDKWDDQDYRVEVWIEKEALVGVIDQICSRLDVDFFACRGYVSQSEQYVAGKRLLDYAAENEQQPVILHLGDHDPSGIDMTRDNNDRLNLFAGDTVIVERIALNMDQIERHNPPPNPAKVTDSRYDQYVIEYGDESWELDALDPRDLQDLISTTVKRYRDQERWIVAVEEERKQRDLLATLAIRWDEVQGYLEGTE